MTSCQGDSGPWNPALCPCSYLWQFLWRGLGGTQDLICLSSLGPSPSSHTRPASPPRPRGGPRVLMQAGVVAGACLLWSPGRHVTVVIKAVCDLVADHHPDAPEVQGLRLVLAEEGRLEDPSREHCPRGQGELSGHPCAMPTGTSRGPPFTPWLGDGVNHPDAQLRRRAKRVGLDRDPLASWRLCCLQGPSLHPLTSTTAPRGDSEVGPCPGEGGLPGLGAGGSEGASLPIWFLFGE